MTKMLEYASGPITAYNRRKSGRSSISKLEILLRKNCSADALLVIK